MFDVNDFCSKGWRIEMEDAHSAVIGIPDQKENVSWFAGNLFFVCSLKVFQINHQEDPADNRRNPVISSFSSDRKMIKYLIYLFLVFDTNY